MKFSGSCTPPKLCSNKQEMKEDNLESKHIKINSSDAIGNKMDPELCMIKVDRYMMAEESGLIRPRLVANYGEMLPPPTFKRSKRKIQQKQESSVMDEEAADESESEEAEESEEESEEGEEEGEEEEHKELAIHVLSWLWSIEASCTS